jgi:hypothetical protein
VVELDVDDPGVELVDSIVVSANAALPQTTAQAAASVKILFILTSLGGSGVTDVTAACKFCHLSQNAHYFTNGSNWALGGPPVGDSQ